MLTSSDITVYHRSVINGAAVFTRSVVEHVHWENRKAANVIASGMIDADSSVVFIPTFNRDVDIKVEDVVVLGIVPDIITGNFNITQLRAKYPDVITVRSVDRFEFGSQRMWHLKVSGK